MADLESKLVILVGEDSNGITHASVHVSKLPRRAPTSYFEGATFYGTIKKGKLVEGDTSTQFLYGEEKSLDNLLLCFDRDQEGLEVEEIYEGVLKSVKREVSRLDLEKSGQKINAEVATTAMGEKYLAPAFKAQLGNLKNVRAYRVDPPQKEPTPVSVESKQVVQVQTPTPYSGMIPPSDDDFSVDDELSTPEPIELSGERARKKNSEQTRSPPREDLLHEEPTAPPNPAPSPAIRVVFARAADANVSPHSERVYTSSEFAKLLGVSERSGAYLFSGLPSNGVSSGFGGQEVVREEEVNKFLRNFRGMISLYDAANAFYEGENAKRVFKIADDVIGNKMGTIPPLIKDLIPEPGVFSGSYVVDTHFIAKFFEDLEGLSELQKGSLELQEYVNSFYTPISEQEARLVLGYAPQVESAMKELFGESRGVRICDIVGRIQDNTPLGSKVYTSSKNPKA